MTIEEIETQFDGEWVLVGDPELDPYNKVARGQVLCHSVDRDVVYDYVKVALSEHYSSRSGTCVLFQTRAKRAPRLEEDASPAVVVSTL